MRRSVTGAMILAALSLGGREAQGTVATLTDDASTVSTSPAANRGKAKTLDVAGPPDSGTVKNAYVHFDLSTLPAGTPAAEVAKATLTVFVKTVASGDGSFDVVRVGAPWTEATITAGGAPALGATEQSAVPVAGSDKNSFKSVDVTNVVKAWVSGSLANNGLALVANAVDGLNVKFDSKESTATSQGPRLEITLQSGLGGTVTSVSASGPLSVTNPNTTPNITLGTVPVGQGGTGATSASAARTNLAAAASGSNMDITALSTLGNGTAAAPSLSFSGDSSTGVFHSAANTLNFTTNGTNRMTVDNNAVHLSGDLELPISTATAGRIVQNGASLLHTFGTANAFLGRHAGNFSMTGSGNVAIGQNALTGNTSGTDNVALGLGALQLNTAGYDNIAIGSGALFSNTTGQGNTAVGWNALTQNTTAQSNAAVGDKALFKNTTGSGNTAVGDGALYTNTTGAQNTGLGDGALNENTADFNTAVGALALGTNSTGAANTAVGTFALESNDTGVSNTAVGFEALMLSTGNENTAVGAGALFADTTGSFNTAVGEQALGLNTTGGANTAVGFFALGANTTGPSNTAVGENALGSNDTGSSNTALGLNALQSNTTGGTNTALGVAALGSNTTAGNNTAVGHGALSANTAGAGNVAAGVNALSRNTSGSNNTAIGNGALQGGAGASGSNNSAMGNSALTAITTGLRNSALGNGALQALTTGNDNTAIGNVAGEFLTTESTDILIGHTGTPGESNAIHLGTNGNQTKAFIAGINGVTSSGGVAVFINASGQLGTTTSSARFKDDIRTMGDASSKLMQLRPVTFRYKKDVDPSGLEQYGLVAEEVAKVYPDLVVYGADGKPETVRYHFINAMLLNEVQKQARRQRLHESHLAELQRANFALARDNASLRKRLANIEQVVGHLTVESRPTLARAPVSAR